MILSIVTDKVTSNPNYEELMKIIVINLSLFRLKFWYRMPLESILNQGKILS